LPQGGSDGENFEGLEKQKLWGYKTGVFGDTNRGLVHTGKKRGEMFLGGIKRGSRSPPKGVFSKDVTGSRLRPAYWGDKSEHGGGALKKMCGGDHSREENLPV